MVSKSFISAAAVAVLASAWQPAAAQATGSEASPPVTRDQRKADTAAANKAGKLTPPGQSGPAVAAPTGPAVTTTERKAQTQADAKAGNLAPAGEANARVPTAKPSKSPQSRAERKAEAAEATKNRKIKSGEGSFR